MDDKNMRVWWVQCKPFPPERRDSDECMQFQTDCIRQHMFGMGWKWDEMNRYAGMEYSLETADALKRYIHSQGDSTRTFSIAQNMYGQMQPGHIVITRLNDTYYAGIVAFVPRVSRHDRLTWYSEVKDAWISLGSSTDLPHHVRGLLSGKNYQGTVAEITGLSAFTIMGLVGVDCPKQVVDANSFAFSLGDGDLEDLMAYYMQLQNPEYVFLPSSCKKNTPGIEYIMYDPKTDMTIACQTKINRAIDVSLYLQEAEYQKYQTIYLYSGKGYENAAALGNSNIHIVSNDDLYQVFKANKRFTGIVEKYFNFS